MDEVLIRFRLSGDFATALLKLSADEFRHPRDEVKHILHMELVERGYLHLNHHHTPPHRPSPLL